MSQLWHVSSHSNLGCSVDSYLSVVTSTYHRNMSFGPTALGVLEHYTSHTPSTEYAWFVVYWQIPILCLHRYGPWNSMLTVLFPDDQGFIITPQRRVPEDSQSHIPDFVIEVVKLTSRPLAFRTVLIRNSQYWPGGIASLDNQISRQADAAFAGAAHTKVYWIGTIGPHWRYGERYDNG